MEKLEDEQIKERAEYNVGHDLITVDVDVNILFEFHIYKGRLFWLEDKQKIFVERFRLIPGELGGDFCITPRYGENMPIKDNICKIINNALGDPIIKKTVDKYIKEKSRYSVQESVDLLNKFEYLSQINEVASAKNVKTRDELHKDSLIQSIIKSNGDFYILVDSTDKDNHYKAVQVYDGSSNKFLVQKISELDLSSGDYEDGESEFKEMVSDTKNTLFDETGKNSYQSIDMFKHDCLTHFDTLNDKPGEEPVKKNNSTTEVETAESAKNKGIDTLSDDIYKSASIDDFPNIRELGKYKNANGEYMDINIQLNCSSLELSNTFGWKNPAEYDITPVSIKNTCLDYRQAKKVSLYINGINRRPKEFTIFAETILPYFHLEFKNIKREKAVRSGKFKK